MKISEDDRQMILAALDAYGAALVETNHYFTPGECAIYDEATNILLGLRQRKLRYKNFFAKPLARLLRSIIVPRGL